MQRGGRVGLAWCFIYRNDEAAFQTLDRHIAQDTRNCTCYTLEDTVKKGKVDEEVSWAIC